MFFSQVVDIQPYIPYITGFGSYYNFVFGVFIASKEKLIQNCNEDAVPLHVGAVALDSAHDL